MKVSSHQQKMTVTLAAEKNTQPNKTRKNVLGFTRVSRLLSVTCAQTNWTNQIKKFPESSVFISHIHWCLENLSWRCGKHSFCVSVCLSPSRGPIRFDKLVGVFAWRKTRAPHNYPWYKSVYLTSWQRQTSTLSIERRPSAAFRMLISSRETITIEALAESVSPCVLFFFLLVCFFTFKRAIFPQYCLFPMGKN